MTEEILSLTNILIIASLIVNLITMFLVITSLKSGKSRITQNGQNSSVQVNKPVSQEPPAEAGVVFCRNCGSQYESTKKACPECNTPR